MKLTAKDLLNLKVIDVIIPEPLGGAHRHPENIAIDIKSSIIKNSIELESDLINNLPVNISVEVGRTKFKIEELMRLTQGSVVELDRLAWEPLDLRVNDVLIAQGEVVLVNEKYGIRLTQVVPKTERLKQMDK